MDLKDKYQDESLASKGKKNPLHLWVAFCWSQSTWMHSGPQMKWIQPVLWQRPFRSLPLSETVLIDVRATFVCSCASQPLFLSEMFCGRRWPAGGDSASRGGREGRSGSVLDAAAENWVQDAPWEEPQWAHTTGAQQTGESVQVNLHFLENCHHTPLCSRPWIAFFLLGSWCR